MYLIVIKHHCIGSVQISKGPKLVCVTGVIILLLFIMIHGIETVRDGPAAIVGQVEYSRLQFAYNTSS